MVVKCYSHVIIPLNGIELDRNSILQYYLLCWCLWKIWNAVKNDDEEDENTRLNIYTRLNVLIYTNVFIVKQSAHFYFRTINAVVLLLPNQNPPCKIYNYEF